MADDDGEGVGLPQKGLNMIIKDSLPDYRIANETRELLNQCCVEFVKHVSREAQIISSKDQRKTIYHDHVQKALKNLGFPREYVDAANSVLGECKIAAEKRLKRKNSRLDKCGIPEEQLWQMQQRLIEQARRNEAEKQQQEQMAAGQFGGGFGVGIGTEFPNQTHMPHQQTTTTGPAGGIAPLLSPDAVAGQVAWPAQSQSSYHPSQQQQPHQTAQFVHPQHQPHQQSQHHSPDQSLQFLAPPAPLASSAPVHLPSPSSSLSHPPPPPTVPTSLPPMMMPFGLNPQQLIVPSSSSTPQFGGALDTNNMAAAAHHLLFQSATGPAKTGAQKDANDGKNEEEEEDEDEEEDYDV